MLENERNISINIFEIETEQNLEISNYTNVSFEIDINSTH